MNNSVLVIGAGPTGLALACGLAAAGVDVRVVDAATQPSVTLRALGLQPRGAEVLDRCGALGDLRSGSDRSAGSCSTSVGPRWPGSRWAGPADWSPDRG